MIGGASRGKQRKALDSHVDLVVATPGRVLAHRDDGRYRAWVPRVLPASHHMARRSHGVVRCAVRCL